MKKLIYITLLFICSGSFGQYTSRYQGKTVVHNGKVVRILADNIPTFPENPESDTMTVLSSLDFNVFAVQDSVTTDTLDDLIDGYYNLIGDTDGVAEYMSIIEMSNGDRVAKATYLVDQCCTEDTDDNWDGGSGGLGTAFGIRYYIDGTETFNYGILSWNEYTWANWNDAVNASGAVKDMGLYNQYDGLRDSRVAFLQQKRKPYTDSLVQTFYAFEYSDNSDTEISSISSYGTSPYTMAADTIGSLRWIHYDMVVYSGTVASTYGNGWQALYKDGVFMSKLTGLKFHSTSDGGQVDFRTVSLELNAGGNQGEWNNMNETSYKAIDNVVFWETDNIDKWNPTTGHTIDAYPDECDYPKSGNPEETTPSTFDGTIYKEVTFAELIPDVNTEARARTFMGSTDIVRWDYDTDSTYADSTTVIINDRGVTDTVWQVKHLAPDNEFVSGKGSSWVGDMQLNGTNTSADTVTKGVFSYYVWLGPNFDFDNSKGGKMLGMAGQDASGYPGPGNGVHSCNCDPEPASFSPYCAGDGFRIRGSYDFYADELGMYSYIRNMSSSLNCTSKTYAYSWSKARIAQDPAQGLPFEREKWYKISLIVDIGTAGNYDGYMQWARNDTVIWSRTSIKFIDDSDVKLDTWFLANHAGGEDIMDFHGHYVRYDDLTFYREDDMSPYTVGDVMTNVPDLPTPNTAE